MTNAVSPVDDLLRGFTEGGNYSIENGVLTTISSSNIATERVVIEISGNNMTLEENQELISCVTILRLERTI